MPYVTRDQNDRIVGLFANSQFEGQEFQEVAELWVDPKNVIRSKIMQIEAQQVQETARMERERALLEAETVALADFGLTPQALYAMGDGLNPPTAALTYRRLKDLDNQVKALREQL